MNTLNRVLTPEDQKDCAEYVEKMRQLVPELMSRKYPEAVFQQAFILREILKEFPSPETTKLLCAGADEDPCAQSLIKMGYSVDLVDPYISGETLEQAFSKPEKYPHGSYDCVFSCSVLEHTVDDVNFVKIMEAYLRPGGKAYLSCDYQEDYKEGDPLPNTDNRFYTSKRLEMILDSLEDSEGLGGPAWGSAQNHFLYEGIYYCFASLAFEKGNKS